MQYDRKLEDTTPKYGKGYDLGSNMYHAASG